MATAGGLLDCCEDAYLNSDVTAGPLGRDGCKIYPDPDGGTILCIRGTTVGWSPADFLDWLNDLRAVPVGDPLFPGRVHHGFLLSAKTLWPLLPLDRLKKPLTITGHSKGGALAQLFGHLLRSMHPRVVTFAAPKAGDDIFAGCVGPMVHRYENPHDIVPREPPFGYTAAGVCTFPAGWKAPRSVLDNHHLATGYRPWVDRDEKVAHDNVNRAA